MAPAFWTAFVRLFRKSISHDFDTYPSTRNGDQSARGGELSSGSDPSPSEVTSLLRRFRENYFLILDTPKPTSLSDVPLINATAAMRLLVAKFKQYVHWVKQNPCRAALIAACIIIPIVFTATTPAILGAIGFSATGPVAGSFAAALQAQIGLVGAGSLFAIVQSAAMAGYGLPIVLGTVWGGTSLVCWGTWAFWNKFMKGPENDDEPGSMAVARSR